MFDLSDLVEAVDKQLLLDDWWSRLPLITAEREAVEAFMAGGGQAYGFTTLFGHLDSIHRGTEGISQLYQGHLVGNPEVLDPQLARGILTMKLCQLSNGGSGISQSTFEQLLTRFSSDLEDVRMDLAASYGSGDVVPGAWFVKSMFGGADSLAAGDLMALINGAYVPAGVVLGALSRVRTVFGRAVSLVSEVAVFARNYEDGVQLPVSLRDTEPLEAILSSGLVQLENAVQGAANRQSANPMFSFDGENAQPRSNSSFLDFELSLAIAGAIEGLRVASAYLVAATRFVAKLGEDNAPDLDKPAFVQLPKVSKAYSDGLSQTQPPYAQAESQGVEDISDGGLIRARTLLRCLDAVSEQTNLLEQALYSARAT